MEVIPRILATNCGAKVVRVLTELRAKQQTEGPTWGIDGTTGKVADMNAKDGPRIWEPYAVKADMTVKTGPRSKPRRSSCASTTCLGHQGPEVDFADPT